MMISIIKISIRVLEVVLTNEMIIILGFDISLTFSY